MFMPVKKYGRVRILFFRAAAFMHKINSVVRGGRGGGEKGLWQGEGADHIVSFKDTILERTFPAPVTGPQPAVKMYSPRLSTKNKNTYNFFKNLISSDTMSSALHCQKKDLIVLYFILLLIFSGHTA